MSTKQEIFQKIQTLLLEKSGGHSKPCSVCGQNEWNIPDRFIRLPATRDSNQFSTESVIGFPIQPLICTTCGNTHLINLVVLGIKPEELQTLVYPLEDHGTK